MYKGHHDLIYLLCNFLSPATTASLISKPLRQGFPNFVTAYHFHFSNNFGVPRQSGVAADSRKGVRGLSLGQPFKNQYYNMTIKAI